MAELSFRMACNVLLQLVPCLLTVANLVAMHTYGQKAL